MHPTYSCALALLCLSACATFDSSPSVTCGQLRETYLDAQNGFSSYRSGVSSSDYAQRGVWRDIKKFSGFDSCKLVVDSEEAKLSCLTEYPRGSWSEGNNDYQALTGQVRACLTNAVASTYRDRSDGMSSKNTSFVLHTPPGAQAVVSVDTWLHLFSRADGGGTHLELVIEAKQQRTTRRQ
jgi:hypothetical protein